MIPFHKLYSWLFKSFNISGETLLLDRLKNEGHSHFMIIKRSWIFALLMLWIPLLILILSGISIYIAYESIEIIEIQYTIIIGNILMSLVLMASSLNYIRHFRNTHHESQIVTDASIIQKELAQWDKYFQSFFNWSITNQWILISIIFIEIFLIFTYWNKIGDHFAILLTDTLVILIEIGLIRKYRKRMMDLEMDYNLLVPGKIFFVNQSGLLSVIQTIEWDKIKTVQSIYPSKIASFFNYGTIIVLTEWDTAMVGTMSMYYVTNPDQVVTYIQRMIDDQSGNTQKAVKENIAPKETKKIESSRHSLDTREKIRDVLR
jgi:hypothetical protein